MKILRTLLVLPLLAVASQAHAGARDRLDAFTRGLQGLSAEFEQKVTNVFNNSGTFVGGSVQGNGIAIGSDSKATSSAGKPSAAGAGGPAKK